MLPVILYNLPLTNKSELNFFHNKIFIAEYMIILVTLKVEMKTATNWDETDI